MTHLELLGHKEWMYTYHLKLDLLMKTIAQNFYFMEVPLGLFSFLFYFL